MTEQPLQPLGADAPAMDPNGQSPRQSNRDAWVYGIGFVILTVALVYVWQNPRVAPVDSAASTALRGIDQRLAETDARIARLEQRPNPDQRLTEIDTRLARLEQRSPPDLGKVNSRIDAIEGRLGDQTQIASRLEAASGRIESLSTRDQTAIDGLKQRLDSLATRFSGVETAAAGIDAMNKRVSRVARIQEASLALAAGRPVGDVPGAPEAVSRYAHTAPPTDASLKLSFPAAAQAALAVQQADIKDAPFADRVWDRAQTLVTVRRGDDVVVGNTSSVIISRAQSAIEAGDLAGAVKALETLNGPPAQAIANWVADAKALLGARSALAAMAGQA